MQMSVITTAWERVDKWSRGQPETSLLDEFIVSQVAEYHGQHFRAVGKGWRHVSRDHAINILDHILSVDLAYSVVQPDPDGEYLNKAQQFLEVFGEEAKFFTNANPEDFGVFPSKGAYSWSPATVSTFDLGVAAVSREYVGIYWAEAED